jgi:hypothetical protein
MLESKFALIGILAKGKTLFETSVASIQIWLRGARTRTQVAAARSSSGCDLRLSRPHSRRHYLTDLRKVSEQAGATLPSMVLS